MELLWHLARTRISLWGITTRSIFPSSLWSALQNPTLLTRRMGWEKQAVPLHQVLTLLQIDPLGHVDITFVSNSSIKPSLTQEIGPQSDTFINCAGDVCRGSSGETAHGYRHFHRVVFWATAPASTAQTLHSSIKRGYLIFLEFETVGQPTPYSNWSKFWVTHFEVLKLKLFLSKDIGSDSFNNTLN
jgi:hypothetical protein